MPDLDVLVLCGGRGTRLGAFTATTPKPLLPVGGRPFLERLLRALEQEGFRRFCLAAHYRHEQLTAFCVAHRARWPDLRVIVEPEPLGTGGALRHAVARLTAPTVMVVNGDSWVSQPLAPVVNAHLAQERVFTAVAVRASRVQGPARDKGVWTVGPDGRFLGFATQAQAETGWVNAGVYVVDRATVLEWPSGCYSLEASFPQLLAHRRAGVFCSEGSLFDIGTPEGYAWADQMLCNTESVMPHEERSTTHDGHG